MSKWIEEYAKHAALNFGQASQGLRYLLTHPKADRIAKRGTIRHMLLSLKLRSKLVANDLFFAILPPHWHHTKEQLASLHAVSLKRWFQAGYGPYRFAETGELLPLHEVFREPRWDPRCDDA